jgi:hypothetical protein
MIGSSVTLKGWLELSRRHCEEQRDEAIQFLALDCFASLAMTVSDLHLMACIFERNLIMCQLSRGT